MGDSMMRGNLILAVMTVILIAGGVHAWAIPL
jgi:hypothetical protein